MSHHASHSVMYLPPWGSAWSGSPEGCWGDAADGKPTDVSLVSTCPSQPQMGRKGPSGEPRPRHSPGPNFNIARWDPELWELGTGPAGAFTTPAQCRQAHQAPSDMPNDIQSSQWAEAMGQKQGTGMEGALGAIRAHVPGGMLPGGHQLTTLHAPSPQALLSDGLTHLAVPAQLLKGRKLPEGRAGGRPAGILTWSSSAPLTRLGATAHGAGPQRWAVAPLAGESLLSPLP